MFYYGLNFYRVFDVNKYEDKILDIIIIEMKAEIAATKLHCKYCFDVLIAKLSKMPLPPYPNNLPDHKVPIFVTWKIKEDLRGCIGTFSPSKLSNILSNYALVSALEDDRFDPV